MSNNMISREKFSRAYNEARDEAVNLYGMTPEQFDEEATREAARLADRLVWVFAVGNVCKRAKESHEYEARKAAERNTEAEAIEEWRKMELEMFEDIARDLRVRTGGQ
tara:strand:- start:1091 stop:1414 length:324 start_codon:yes stop_codon:yes gene_type:complete